MIGGSSPQMEKHSFSTLAIFLRENEISSYFLLCLLDFFIIKSSLKSWHKNYYKPPNFLLVSVTEQ